MRKILVLLFVFSLSISIAISKEKDYSLNFNGERYDLLYSVKDPEFGGYLNEYYKHGETYNIWSEMVAVHHFPNAYSPIDRIKDFKDYLAALHVPSSLTFDDKNNSAMIDFIMITTNKMPVVLEFNIFKYEKSKKCGSVAVQYVKRYSATTTMQIEGIKKDFEKNRKILLKKVKSFNIPAVITHDIDKCISGIEVKGNPEEENKPSEIAADNPIEKNEIPEIEKTEEQDISENRIADTAVVTDETKETRQEEKQNQSEIADETTSEQNINKDEEIQAENIQSNEINNNSEKITDKDNSKEEKEEKDEVIADTKENAEYVDTKEEKAVIPNAKENKIAKEEKEPETELETKNESIQAPIPNKDVNKESQVIRTSDIQSQETKERERNSVNTTYKLVNNKEEFISTPRTKKELKKEVKQKKKEFKQKQKQAKKIKKMNKKSYEIVNNNKDLISTPRTKKELKKQNKMLKKQAKEKARKTKVKQKVTI